MKLPYQNSIEIFLLPTRVQQNSFEFIKIREKFQSEAPKSKKKQAILIQNHVSPYCVVTQPG